MKYGIDTQFKKYAYKLPFSRLILCLSRIFLERAVRYTKTQGAAASLKKENGLFEYTFSPKGSGETTPCVLFFHGGGFGYPAAPHHKRLASTLADMTGFRVIMPEYRLLPKYKYPAARSDALSAYKRMCERFPKAEGFAVMGDSAGGALAAYASCDAIKEGLPPPRLQMLLYPVAEENAVNGSMKKFTDTPLWNAKNNSAMWKMYLDKTGDEEASPTKMHLPKNPPPLYIELAEFDCLHDEGLDYAKRIEKTGAKTEIFEVRGAPHGFDIAEEGSITRECIKRRAAALKKAFSDTLRRE